MKSLFFFLAGSVLASAGPILTVYDQGFAVVRDSRSLDLKQGLNTSRIRDLPSELQPASFLLHDAAGKVQMHILDLAYQNNLASSAFMLFQNEGKTIDFLVKEPSKPDSVVQGKIIQSGFYSPMSPLARANQGLPAEGYQPEAQGASRFGGQPVIETEGKLQFSLPGVPIFPAPGAENPMLKPQIELQIESDRTAKIEAELCYVTGGLAWTANYNVVAAEKQETVEFTGYATLNNYSGATFENARVNLMIIAPERIAGGDPQALEALAMRQGMREGAGIASGFEKSPAETDFFPLERPITLRDREIKEVEFARTEGVKSEKIYLYDGALIEPQRWGGRISGAAIRENQDFGVDSTSDVRMAREFGNSAANHLGLALPGGPVRVYQRGDTGEIRLIGIEKLDPVGKDGTVRINAGTTPDLSADRRRTSFQINHQDRAVDESFEITLRSQKNEPVEIRVVEHLYRGSNWEIRDSSNTFLKTGTHSIEFRIALKPSAEQKMTYTVHYSPG